MSKKRISFIVSLLFGVYLLILQYESRIPIVPERQVSNVVHTQLEEQGVLTADVTVSTTTQSFFVVSRVVDGDTIEVIKDNKEEKVRLIGINTPETVDPRKKVECFGKEASAHAKEILVGQNITLAFDDTQTKYDKYGRLLAYVYREDGLFVNKHMIQEGYAYEYTYKVPYLFQKEFKEAQKQAESKGKGLWGAGVCE